MLIKFRYKNQCSKPLADIISAIGKYRVKDKVTCIISISNSIKNTMAVLFTSWRSGKSKTRPIYKQRSN